jgi:hypothetical protein
MHLFDPKQEVLFHEVVRQYSYTERKVFYSLGLSFASLESIFWVLRSIEEDRMEPSLILIQSRFKECFGFRLGMKEWVAFAREFSRKGFKKFVNKYASIFGELEMFEKEEEHFIFRVKNRRWNFED